LLIRADHLQENALYQAWEQYKEGNHHSYFGDKRLKIVYILQQRKVRQEEELKQQQKRLQEEIATEEEEIEIPSIPSEDDDFIITFSDDDNDKELNETIVAAKHLFVTPTKKNENSDDISLTSSSNHVIDFENNSSVNTLRRSQSQSPHYPMSHRFDSFNSHRDYRSVSPRSVSIDYGNENIAPYICESSVSPLKQSVNKPIVNRSQMMQQRDGYLEALTKNMNGIQLANVDMNDDDLDFDDAVCFKLIDADNKK
jgi:hypothetical protein